MDNSNKPTTSGISITGFTLGLISWFLNFWGIIGLLAIIFSAIGLAQPNTKKGFAITGLVSGIINVLYAFSILMRL